MLVNDTDGSFLGANPDAFDVIRGPADNLELIVDGVSSLDGSLRMEFSRVGDLEKDVLHNI